MIGALQWLYRQTTEKLYREWAGLYDLVSFVVSLGHWQSWRLQVMAFTGGGPVLELGFGTGHLQVALARLGRPTFGADASPEMVVRTARRLRKQGLPVRLVQARAQALPFAGERFGSVVSTFPAQYILDEATLSECARVVVARDDGGSAGRLAIVGLWVRTDRAHLRMAFVPFYGAPDRRFLMQTLRSIQAKGFAPAVAEEVHGAFAVGSIVAVRETQRSLAGPLARRRASTWRVL